MVCDSQRRTFAHSPNLEENFGHQAPLLAQRGGIGSLICQFFAVNSSSDQGDEERNGIIRCRTSVHDSGK